MPCFMSHSVARANASMQKKNRKTTKDFNCNNRKLPLQFGFSLRFGDCMEQQSRNFLKCCHHAFRSIQWHWRRSVWHSSKAIIFCHQNLWLKIDNVISAPFIIIRRLTVWWFASIELKSLAEQRWPSARIHTHTHQNYLHSNVANCAARWKWCRKSKMA